MTHSHSPALPSPAAVESGPPVPPPGAGRNQYARCVAQTQVGPLAGKGRALPGNHPRQREGLRCTALLVGTAPGASLHRGAFPADALSQLLRYEPETGKLFWRERDLALFPLRRVGLAFNSTYAGREAFTATDSRGYKSGRIFDKTYPAHRVAWAVHYGHWPEVIDHINGDRADNRIANLRNVTKAENARNRRSTGKPLGVQFDAKRGLWRARVTFNYLERHVGYFTTEQEALAARQVAIASLGFHPLHGEVK